MKNHSLLNVGAFALAASLIATGAANAAPNQPNGKTGGPSSTTAQSIGISAELDGRYHVDNTGQTRKWKVNGQPASVIFFDAHWILTPSTTGTAPTGWSPLPANQDTSTKAKIDTFKHKVVQDEADKFLSAGNVLGNYAISFSFKQKIGSVNYSWSVTYNATPTAPTNGTDGWELTGGNASETVQLKLKNLFVDSQSFVYNSGVTRSAPWHFKYSWSLADAYGIPLVSDDAGTPGQVTVHIKKDDVDVATFDVPVQIVNPTEDWTYNVSRDADGNPLKFGNATAFDDLYSGSVVKIMNGGSLGASGVISKDDFSGNNNTYGQRAEGLKNAVDGEGNPVIWTATVSPTEAVGNYAVLVSGTVKGNSFTGAQTFGVSLGQFSLSSDFHAVPTSDPVLNVQDDTPVPVP